MTALIRTELYKLRTYGRFHKLLLIFSLVNFGVMALILAFFEKIALLAEGEITGEASVNIAEALGMPFAQGLLSIFMFITAVSFFYMDFANGYVKNIAGQIKNKSCYVISKLVAVAVNNLIFFLASTLTMILAAAVTDRFKAEGDIVGGITTLLLKWLLSVALCAILLFLSVGIKNHTLGVIVAVVLSTNTLSLIYMGVNYGVEELFKVKNFNIKVYSPTSLLGTVDAMRGTLVANAIIVSVIFIVLFVYLSCKVFKSRDIH